MNIINNKVHSFNFVWFQASCIANCPNRCDIYAIDKDCDIVA